MAERDLETEESVQLSSMDHSFLIKFPCVVLVITYHLLYPMYHK